MFINTYRIFVDLIKAFYDANRNVLWIILKKLGWLLNLLEYSKHEMKVYFSLALSEPIPVEKVSNNVTCRHLLWSLYTWWFYLDTSSRISNSVCICDLEPLVKSITYGISIPSKTFGTIRRVFLYVGDVDLMINSSKDVQMILEI